MSSWQGKSKGAQGGYRIFVWILRHLGVQPAYWLLRFVSFYYFLVSWKTSRPVLQLYRRGLGMSRLRALLYLYKNYYRLGQTLIDKVAIQAGLARNFTCQSDGVEHLEAIASGNRGGILLSAHLGNWEIAGHFLKKLDRKINLVMFDGERQALKEYLGQVTGAKSFNIIAISPDNSHIFQIVNALGNNELVCMHTDRFLPGNKTLSVPFLGRMARFPEGPFLLGTKLRAPVSFVFAMKESSTHYRFSASPLLSQSPQQKSDPRLLLEEFVSELENKVRQYPEQWFNYHPFWDEN